MAKKKKKNSFSPILVLAIVIVLAGVCYFGYKNIYTKPSSTQVNIVTTKWKTYSDTKYGYSLQYPDDWLVTGAKIYPKPECPVDKTFTNKDCMDGYVTFSVYKIPNGQSLATFIKNLDTSRNLDEPQIYDKKYMPSNLVRLGAIEANYMGMYGPLVAYIPKGDSVIEIYFYNIDSDTIKSINSTFKFTK